MEDLIFTGQSPVVITYNGSSDDIYSPLRTTSCNIAIVDKNILDDLYTANKDEIGVKIEKKIPQKTTVIEMTDPGEVTSLQVICDVGDEYISTTRALFFTDINGDFRFNGVLENQDTWEEEEVTLKYNHTTNKWERSNDWDLVYNDHYFHTDGESYRVYYDGANHKVQEWNSNTYSWGTAVNYRKDEDGVDTDCAYGAENIINTIDDYTQLVWGQKTYWWDFAHSTWIEDYPYTDDTGEYFALYGETYMRVRNKQGNIVDALCINGYSAQGVENGEWIVSINPDDHTFQLMIPITVESTDDKRVFSDLNGDVYYVASTGKIYVWSWDVEDWCEWMSFDGDCLSGTFQLDYKIPGNTPSTCKGMTKTAVIKYQNIERGWKYFMLTNTTAPAFTKKEVIVPGEFITETIWEGYKMPNTYSQDVTQNLDMIEMTCIDPLSIMKWVKIDHLITKPKIMKYGELIALALSYVQIRPSRLLVDRSVVYGSSSYQGNNGLLDLSVQVANFWDESGEPTNVYDMISEMLRPFCLTMVYTGDSFQIYNATPTTLTRVFTEYTVTNIGTLTYVGEVMEEKNLFEYDTDWISNNVENAKIDINTTYDKVIGYASTCEPNYSRMVGDTIDYNDRNNYNVNYFNVQRNKTKGCSYNKNRTPKCKSETDDMWYYIWNGVYQNSDFGLIAYTGSFDPGTGDPIPEQYLDGWENINDALKYVNGTSGYPDRFGAIYNYYGGSNNPTGTGKTQDDEKSVEVNERITSYWIDNGSNGDFGIVPEFFEDTDLEWVYQDNYPVPQGTNAHLTKPDTSTNTNFGISSPGTTYPSTDDKTELVYHQEYDNINLDSIQEQTIDFRLTQSYSRTGVATGDIEIENNTYVYDKEWYLVNEGSKYRAYLKNAKVRFFPEFWNTSNVVVNHTYFNVYDRGSNDLISPVFDRRMVTMYVTYKDENDNDVVYQFNGREWVEGNAVDTDNSFYLLKVVNEQKIFNEDFQYNIIEFKQYIDDEGNTVPEEDYDSGNKKYTSRRRYSLEEEDVVFYTDSDGAFRKKPRNNIFHKDRQHKYTPYGSEDNEWYVWVNKCGPGELSIVLPDIDMPGVKVVVDISCSSLRGMCASDGYTSQYSKRVPVVCTVDGTGVVGQSTIPLTPQNCSNYGEFNVTSATINFIPPIASFIRAEHLDLDISVSVPQSNVGKMFSQSDIKYISEGNKNYLEEYSDLKFRVNTYNSMVADSYSYLLYDNEIADPGSFVINGHSSRPEVYTVQAYSNWLTQIRKIYSKTILPKKDGFSAYRTFIKSPEICKKNWREELEEVELMIVSDVWDVKTNRHSVVSVESDGLEIDWINSFSAVEVPRMARSDRWNLPTAYK